MSNDLSPKQLAAETGLSAAFPYREIARGHLDRLPRRQPPANRALGGRRVERKRTLLVEQRLIGGEIVPGQMVRCFRPRAVDLIRPLKQDLTEYRMAIGRPSAGPLFARRDDEPWRVTDVNDWRRRVCTPRASARRRTSCAS